MVEYEDALYILKEEGYKITDKRKDMIKILAKEDRYMSAREVYIEMIKIHPAISLDTIYRNLQTYAEIGILEDTEWNNERVYRYSCGVDAHHHHFICTECGKTMELLSCPMELYEEQLPGYRILDHRFEVFGLCDQCDKNVAACEA